MVKECEATEGEWEESDMQRFVCVCWGGGGGGGHCVGMGRQKVCVGDGGGEEV